MISTFDGHLAYVLVSKMRVIKLKYTLYVKCISSEYRKEWKGKRDKQRPMQDAIDNLGFFFILINDAPAMIVTQSNLEGTFPCAKIAPASEIRTSFAENAGLYEIIAGNNKRH